MRDDLYIIDTRQWLAENGYYEDDILVENGREYVIDMNTEDGIPGEKIYLDKVTLIDEDETENI